LKKASYGAAENDRTRILYSNFIHNCRLLHLFRIMGSIGLFTILFEN